MFNATFDNISVILLLYTYRPVQPIAVELNVIEKIGDTIYEEINSNGQLPEVEETDFPSEASFPDDIESKYEDIDDLRTDKHEYLYAQLILFPLYNQRKFFPHLMCITFLPQNISIWKKSLPTCQPRPYTKMNN